MKKNIGLVLVLVLIGVMVYSFIKEETEEQQVIAQLGVEEPIDEGVAPDFTLETLNGDTLTLSDLKGKKVILNFWATWCPPCRTEMPHLEQYYKEYGDKDNVEIVAVAETSREPSVEHVQEFVNSYKLTFPIALATEDTVLDLYRIITIPSTIFIDTEGKMQYRIVGPLDEKTVREYVKKLN